MESLSFGLAFAAGVVSVLSPCVLPLLPVVFSTALAEHRFGPLFLTAGLAVSFLVLGILVSTLGFYLGLDSETFRNFGAMLLVVVGLVLVVPTLHARSALIFSPLGNWAGKLAGSRSGLDGQFLVGLLLGAVWSPCIGPTLGAASVLAAQGRNLGQVALTMLLFAIGASLPLLVLGFVSREALIRWRGRVLSTGATGKLLLGFIFVGSGVLVLSGIDKLMESALVRAMPTWVIDLTGSL